MACPIVYAAEVDTTEPTEPTSPEDSTEENEDENTKKWYDYLADKIGERLGDLIPIVGIVEEIKELLSKKDSFVNLFENFFDLLETWGDGFEKEWKEITDAFDNLNNGTINFIKSVWEFPILKELSVLLVGLIAISAVFILFKSF